MYSYFFFLLIRRPPRPTPFPTRRSSDLVGPCRHAAPALCDRSICWRDARPGGPMERLTRRSARSEEHTSELQSRLHLVCRLLLEKKKTEPEPISTSYNNISILTYIT